MSLRWCLVYSYVSPVTRFSICVHASSSSSRVIAFSFFPIRISGVRTSITGTWVSPRKALLSSRYLTSSQSVIRSSSRVYPRSRVCRTLRLIGSLGETETEPPFEIVSFAAEVTRTCNFNIFVFVRGRYNWPSTTGPAPRCTGWHCEHSAQRRTRRIGICDETRWKVERQWSRRCIIKSGIVIFFVSFGRRKFWYWVVLLFDLFVA